MELLTQDLQTCVSSGHGAWRWAKRKEGLQSFPCLVACSLRPRVQTSLTFIYLQLGSSDVFRLSLWIFMFPAVRDRFKEYSQENMCKTNTSDPRIFRQSAQIKAQSSWSVTQRPQDRSPVEARRGWAHLSPGSIWSGDASTTIWTNMGRVQSRFAHLESQNNCG